eukprot:tig00001187_g7473.t1
MYDQQHAWVACKILRYQPDKEGTHPQWREVQGEPEPGERACCTFELQLFRRHRLVLEPRVLPPQFAGGVICVSMVQSLTGAPILGESRLLIDYASRPKDAKDDDAGLRAAAKPSIELRVGPGGETSDFGVAISSHHSSRRRMMKFWLRVHWRTPGDAGLPPAPPAPDVFAPFKLYVVAKVKARRAFVQEPIGGEASEAAPGPAPGPSSAPALATGQGAPSAGPFLLSPEHVALIQQSAAQYTHPVGFFHPGPQAPVAQPPPARQGGQGRAAPPASKRAQEEGAEEGRGAPSRRRPEAAAPEPLPPGPGPAPAPPAEAPRPEGLEERFSRLALAATALVAAPAPPATATSEQVSSLKEYSASLDAYSGKLEAIVARLGSFGHARAEVKGEPEGDDASAGAPDVYMDLIEIHRRVPLAHDLIVSPAVPLLGEAPRFPCLLAPAQVVSLEELLRRLHAEAAAAGTPEAADRLRDAMADVRVLATGIVQDEMGGIEFKDMLQTVRASRRSDAGPRAVVTTLLRAVLARPPSAMEPGELEACARQATAFLECGASISRSAMDLWLLDADSIDALASLLLEATALLGEPEAAARAAAATGFAMALVRHTFDDALLHRLLEAWEALRRTGRVPSRAEVELLRATMQTLMRLSAANGDRYEVVTRHVSLALYWYAGGEMRDRLSEVVMRHQLAHLARAQGQRGADKQYEELEALVFCEPPPRAIHCAASFAILHYDQIVHCVKNLNIVRAVGLLRAHLAFERRFRMYHHAADDWVNVMRYWWRSWKPTTLVRVIRVLAALYRESPHSAHLLFALGDLSAATGDHARALEAFEECIQIYGLFDAFFPPTAAATPPSGADSRGPLALDGGSPGPLFGWSFASLFSPGAGTGARSEEPDADPAARRPAA